MRSMKRLGIIAAVALVVVVAGLTPLAGTVVSATRLVHGLFSNQAVAALPKGLKMHRVQAGTPGKDGWYEAKSTEGHFRVSLPIPFNDGTVNSEANSEGIGYLIGSKSAEGFRFSAFEWVPVKKRVADQSLKEFVQGFRSNPDLRVSSEKHFRYQGNPAVEIKISGPKTGAWSRVVVHPERLYTLTVEYPIGSEDEVKPMAEGFLDSLRIEAKRDETQE